MFDSYYGDYSESYFEPDEIEWAAREFQDKVLNAAKEQFKKRIEDLEQEVRELKEFRDLKDTYERKMNMMQYEIERAKEEAAQNAKRLKAKDYMDILSKPAFVVNCEWRHYKPKCDKCDNDRKIHFTSPMGKQMTEPCSCSGIRRFYSVSEAVVYESEPEDKHRFVGYVDVNCFRNTHTEDDPRFEVCRYVWSGQKDMKYMLDNNYYELIHTYFFNRKDCEEACKLLQEKADKELENK